MKRYFLFKGQNYYPRGGMDDFVAAFIDLNTAVNEAKKLIPYETDWSHVYDSKRHVIVARFIINESGEPDFDSDTWHDKYPWDNEDRAWIKANAEPLT